VSLLLDEVELLPEVLLLLLVAVIVDSKSIASSGILHKNQSAGSRSLTPETENYLKTGSRLKGSCARCTIAQRSVKLSIIIRAHKMTYPQRAIARNMKSPKNSRAIAIEKVRYPIIYK